MFIIQNGKEELMEGEKMSIGDILYLERHKRRLTLRDVAYRIDCSAMYIYKIETGKLLPLRSNILSKLSELYGLNRDKIYQLAYEEDCQKQMHKRFETPSNEDEQKTTTAARRNIDMLKQNLKKGKTQ